MKGSVAKCLQAQGVWPHMCIEMWHVLIRFLNSFIHFKNNWNYNFLIYYTLRYLNVRNQRFWVTLVYFCHDAAYILYSWRWPDSLIFKLILLFFFTNFITSTLQPGQDILFKYFELVVEINLTLVIKYLSNFFWNSFSAVHTQWWNYYLLQI